MTDNKCTEDVHLKPLIPVQTGKTAVAESAEKPATESNFRLIRQGKICFGGNRKLKIYGHLHCASGKRMKPQNRVFFKTVADALGCGYRPCGRCMRNEYLLWKKQT